MYSRETYKNATFKWKRFFEQLMKTDGVMNGLYTIVYKCNVYFLYIHLSSLFDLQKYINNSRKNSIICETHKSR